VKKELPQESIKFVGIDQEVKVILADAFKLKKALDFCIQPHILPGLEKVQENLTVCEKALNEFMDSKRTAFPRFYFVSPADLLDILSNGNQPTKVMIHMPKIISALDTLELLNEGERPFAIAMIASVGVEKVVFTEKLKLLGKVETYLEDVLQTMRKSLREISKKSLQMFAEKPKQDWIVMDPAMVTLLINNCQWVILCETAFKNYPSDNKSVEKAYQKQCDDLTELIKMVQTDLTKPVRQKIMCLITMDAHSRDIISILVNEKVTRVDDF
jgi:dynein heavy chain, axonemal